MSTDGVKCVKYLLLIKIKEYLRQLKPLIACNHLVESGVSIFLSKIKLQRLVKAYRFPLPLFWISKFNFCIVFKCHVSWKLASFIAELLSNLKPSIIKFTSCLCHKFLHVSVKNLFISRYNLCSNCGFVFFYKLWVTENAITNSSIHEVVLNSCVSRSNVFITFVFLHHSLLSSSFLTHVEI